MSKTSREQRGAELMRRYRIVVELETLLEEIDEHIRSSGFTFAQPSGSRLVSCTQPWSNESWYWMVTVMPVDLGPCSTCISFPVYESATKELVCARVKDAVNHLLYLATATNKHRIETCAEEGAR